MVISVVIPTVAGSSTIADLLVHLSTFDMGLPPSSYEVIAVVDGGEPFSFPSEINGVQITVTSNQRYRGAAGARNTGALLAKGDYLLFLDDDTFPSEGALAVIVEEFRRLGPRSALGITVNQLLYDPSYMEQLRKTLIGHFFLSEYTKWHFYTPHSIPASFLCSGAMAMSRSFFFSVGGFRELPPQHWHGVGLYISGEDTELSHRLLQEGGRLFFIGGIRFIARERQPLTPKIAFHRRFIEGYARRILWEQMGKPPNRGYKTLTDSPFLDKILSSKYGLIMGYFAWFLYIISNFAFRLTRGKLAWHHPLLLALYAFEYAGMRFAEEKIEQNILSQQQWIK
ncbi:MAG: glycosyltransferase [Bacteroidia bacterium]|nr:glycosyltransferase [Bacteroidia bacterium]MDW8089042.1 glycosyltransferase [Bacteroidia bacterium]